MKEEHRFINTKADSDGDVVVAQELLPLVQSMTPTGGQ